MPLCQSVLHHFETLCYFWLSVKLSTRITNLFTMFLTWVISIDLGQAGVKAEGVVSPVSAGCAADVVTTRCLTLRLLNYGPVFRSRDQCYPITGQYSDILTYIDQSQALITWELLVQGPSPGPQGRSLEHRFWQQSSLGSQRPPNLVKQLSSPHSSRPSHWPIIDEYSVHVTSINQSQISIEVTWLVFTWLSVSQSPSPSSHSLVSSLPQHRSPPLQVMGRVSAAASLTMITSATCMLSNQRTEFRSFDLHWPIRYEKSGQVISIDQCEVSIQVTWQVLTNHRSVFTWPTPGSSRKDSSAISQLRLWFLNLKALQFPDLASLYWHMEAQASTVTPFLVSTRALVQLPIALCWQLDKWFYWLTIYVDNS